MRSDCIVLGGRSVCKEGKEGEKTCLKDLDRKCSCMADQFCSANNTCVTEKPEGSAPGKKRIFSINVVWCKYIIVLMLCYSRFSMEKGVCP